LLPSEAARELDVRRFEGWMGGHGPGEGGKLESVEDRGEEVLRGVDRHL
jgi:hypothetical protein